MVMKNWILQRVTLGMRPRCSLKDCAKLKMIDLGLASRFKRSDLAHLLSGKSYGWFKHLELPARFLRISTTIWITVSIRK